MNKIVSGAVAGAAGIVLLLGGAGSFALWNANATVAASSVSAGNLALAADTTGVWTDITNPSTPKVIDPATYRIVPGNVLQYKSALTVTATGDSLAADLTYNPLSISGDAALKAAVTTKLDVTSTDASITAGTAANTFTVKPSTAASKVNVVLTVTFPSSATTGQNGTLSFDKLAFTLTQRAI
jgi:alternate signal-mediated exported protein